MRFVAGWDAVAEVLLAGALREGWSEAEVCAEKLPLSGDLSGGNALLRLQRGKVCRCSGDVVGSQCCIIGKPPAEAATQKPKRWSQGAEPGSRCLLTAN